MRRGKEKIVHGTKLSTWLVLGTAFMVSLALGNGAAAQEEAGALSFEMTPSRDSGVSGTAALTDVSGGVEVTVSVEGLEGAREYVHHVHEGATCEEDKVDQGGPVEFPLNPVTADEDGTASVTSIVDDTTVDGLLDGSKERYINFHPAPPEGASVPPGIACTTLDATAGRPTLPASGGTNPTVLLSAGAILVACATTTALVLRRRWPPPARSTFCPAFAEERIPCNAPLRRRGARRPCSQCPG